MPDSILSHRAFPPVDAGEKRIGCKPYNLPKLLANNAQDFLIGSLENMFITRAANEATQERTIVWCAVGKLVVHKGGRKHAFAFTARHQKTEAGRKGRA